MFKFVMAQEFGDYQGLTNKVLYDQGKRVRSVRLGAHISLRGGFDTDVANKLKLWTLTKFARGVQESPRQSQKLLEPTGRTEGRGGWRADDQGKGFVHENRRPSAIQEPEPLLNELKSLTVDDDEDHNGPTTRGGEGHPLLLRASEPKGLHGEHNQRPKPSLTELAVSPAWLTAQHTAAVDWVKSPLNSRPLVVCESVQKGLQGDETQETKASLTGIEISPAWSSSQASVAVDWFKSGLNYRETNYAERHDGGLGVPNDEAKSGVLGLRSKYDRTGDVGSAGLGLGTGFSLGKSKGEVSVLKDLQAAKRRVRNRASAHEVISGRGRSEIIMLRT